MQQKTYLASKSLNLRERKGNQKTLPQRAAGDLSETFDPLGNYSHLTARSTTQKIISTFQIYN